MKFRTKLYASIGSILLLISIVVFILLNMLQQSTVEMHVVVNELNDRINMSSDIMYETANIGRELREITADQSNENFLTRMNGWEQSNVNLKLALESLEKHDTQQKSQELIAKFKTLHTSYQDIAQQVITVQRLDSEAFIDIELWEEAEITRQRMLQIGELLHGLQEQELKNELFRSRDTYNWAVKIIYIYFAVGLGLAIAITLWVIRSITKNLNNVTTVMESVTSRNVAELPRIAVRTKDEFGKIAAAFNKMATELERQSKLEIRLKNEAEEHSWLQTKIAEIATMYPKVKDIQMLAEMLIVKLVPMVGGSVGIFYMKEVEEGQQYMKKRAAYALVDHSKDFDRFKIGEGLIGQCVAEQKTIYLTHIPDNYIKIHSGIGVTSPKSSIIIPVKFEGEVLAVVEIASLHSFSSSQVKLLEEIMSNLGLTMNSIMNRMRVDKLLQESQSLTEELQAQSEELQVQQEELRTTNEKLEEQYESSELKAAELEKVREDLEEKAQQLELSSQYKSEFLANMSHELRTPLNSLLILAKILSENGDGNLSGKQQEYIRTIYSSGQDLLHLINDILDLAKVESGKLEVVSKEVELKKVQDFIERQFTPIARQKGVSLTVYADELVPIHLRTDEHRLQQILKNLLSNAFKFTEKGSVALVIQKVKTPQPLLAFSVTDTGIGIAKDKQDTIFEVFKQADGTTSRQYGGTGLGLSISREIAYLLGGHIDIDSEEGKGSTFTLYLPYDEVSEWNEENLAITEVAASVEEEVNLSDHEELMVQQQYRSLLKDKKILIVDDDVRNVFALTSALEKYEININFAESGKEALKELQDHPDTDLILMDIMMPDMDGFEAMRLIRNKDQFTSLPIIAVTAKAMKHNRDECIAAGASDYISKPIDLDQLFSLMSVWLYRKKE
ncbi:response regulator [Halalkalibacter okhensis]|uniref:Circadian input-output histidine kinase CikA n=1 Tax=Halalkalibacter okhensis TaxID=333138 RepID=A0A0B0I8Z4_9BACI|nr:response regulator [Halalkalibacter okhensis]KHF38958.1 hypothetical protein LQ50_18150 [Halalkalibacter okhensis]